jgi:amino acid adenylation domain-containing protein
MTHILDIIRDLQGYRVQVKAPEGQLKLVGETSKLPKELIQLVRDHKAELLEFLEEAARQTKFESIPKIEEAADYELSNAQRRVWLLSQFDGGDVAYNIVSSIFMKGPLQLKQLNKAFAKVIERHESLRTVFLEVDEEPRQRIEPTLDFEVGFEDISAHTDKDAAVEAAIAVAANWKFELEKGPLLRIELLKLEDGRHAMLFVMHHIISDGWSIGVLMQEVMGAYAELCEKGIANIPALNIQYKDYSAWLKSRLNGEEGQKMEAFWSNSFSDIPEPLQLPTDRVRPSMKNYAGKVLKVYFGENDFERFSNFAKAHNTTLFTFLQSVLNVLLYKYSGQENLVIGTPVSGRNHFDLEGQIGLFVNTLALKSKVQPEQSFEEYLKATMHETMRAFEYQDFPFDRLVETLEIPRDTARNPLFDVMLVLQNTAVADGSIDMSNYHGISLHAIEEYFGTHGDVAEQGVAAKFDLSFAFGLELGNKFCVEIEYSSDLFDRARIQQMHNHFVEVVNQCISSPEGKISDIELVSTAERTQVLEQFNAPIGEIKEHSIPALLEEAFSTHADKIAVYAAAENITYSELNERSDRIAQWLKPQLEKADQPFVGIVMNRTAWTLSTIIGILKAGAAYVPVDPTYPQTRIDFILEDVQPAVIICDEALQELIPTSLQNRVNTMESVIAESQDLTGTIEYGDWRESTAYLIYTSGSTGTPKGVELCHRNTITFLNWATKEFANTPYELLYAATSYCFDLSVFEFFVPLLQGKSMRLLQNALEIPAHLPNDENVLLNTVPSVVRGLLDEQVDLSSVVALNMAGEAVPKVFRTLLPHTTMEVRNLYGPSEDTTYSTIYRFAEDGHEDVPIGIPVGDTQVYILDNHQNLLPVGVDGEIYLSGQSVAKGYFNREDLTAERFIENPFVAGQRMYRTGDIGRWLPSGEVAFVGRTDDQVKVRGFRIELGEIQFLLEQQEGVDAAVVVVSELDGDQAIVAYWEGESAESSALKTSLSAALPAYMIPTYWVKLEAIPLNSNGKVDKKALPLPNASSIEGTAIVEPENELQAQMLEIWSQVLKTGDFGIKHSFFEIGGHSLKAVRLSTAIHQQLDKQVSLTEIFKYPTVEQLCAVIENKATEVFETIETVEEQEHYPLSFTQERLWVLTQFEEASAAYHMPAAFEVKGELDAIKMQKALEFVIDRHESLRTVFREVNGVPVQHVLKPDRVNFKLVVELVKPFDDESQKEIFLQDRWSRAFDLAEGPLLRCFLLIQPDGKQILSFNMHHIVSDGWSVGVLFKEVMHVYGALTKNEIPALKPLEVQYKDFTNWQKKELSADRLEAHESYWKETFEAELSPLSLPYDNVRPEVKTYAGNTKSATLNRQLTNKVLSYSQERGSSLFMLLKSAVDVFLSKYSGQSDITVGTPVAGREHVQLEDQIGFYVNTLPLRASIDAELSFQELLTTQSKHILEAFEHQVYPFEMLVEALQLKRDMSRSPLFDVLVVLQNNEGFSAEMLETLPGDVQFTHCAFAAPVAKYDLTFSFAEGANGIEMQLEYNTNLFKDSTITRMLEYFEQVVSQCISNPEGKISDIELISTAERTQVLEQFNAPIGEIKEHSIPALLQEAFSTHADKIAVYSANENITYSELNERSDRIAQWLKPQLEKADQPFVGIVMNRTAWTLSTIIGILKAGAAYVPVDPTYPQTRIDFILEDVQPAVIICDEALQELIPTALQNRMNTIESVIVDSKDLTGAVEYGDWRESTAYLIYTSGSTGAPKGVELCHRNTTAFLNWATKEFANTPYELLYAATSYCFDLSVFEFFVPLLQGKSIRMLQNALEIPVHLPNDENVLLNTVPSVVRALLDEQVDLSSVVALNMAGEAVPKVFRSLLPCNSMEVRNLYGPSEDTTYSTIYRFAEDGHEDVPIGIPVGDTQVYILDANQNLLPIGIDGEIYLSGQSVAKGYFNREDLTAERFIENPFVAGQRMYRTGDIGRWLPSGEVAFVGRTDDQVKVRGFRIELGEIQFLLEQQEGVDAAVVVVSEVHGEPTIVAYWEGSQEDEQTLKAALSQSLPAYMIPTQWLQLDSIPLNSNGKIDRSKLQAPEEVAAQKTEFVAPRNEIDEQIVKIWEDVLSVSPIGIKDNFFDLGGHSLKATRVISRIQSELQVKIDLKSLFVDPTIENLSNYVETMQWMDSEVETPAEEQEELIL